MVIPSPAIHNSVFDTIRIYMSEGLTLDEALVKWAHKTLHPLPEDIIARIKEEIDERD